LSRSAYIGLIQTSTPSTLRNCVRTSSTNSSAYGAPTTSIPAARSAFAVSANLDCSTFVERRSLGSAGNKMATRRRSLVIVTLQLRDPFKNVRAAQHVSPPKTAALGHPLLPHGHGRSVSPESSNNTRTTSRKPPSSNLPYSLSPSQVPMSTAGSPIQNRRSVSPVTTPVPPS